MRPQFKIAVVGLWHLGEIYSAGLAEIGHEVLGLDDDVELIKNFNAGTPPLPEPELQNLLSKNLSTGRLRYSTDFSEIKNCNALWIAFDTPVDEQDESDLRPIWSAIERLTPHISEGALVVVSSQIPVGTSKKIKEFIARKRPGLNFEYAYAPENLRLGEAVQCFMEPGRVVVGTDSDVAAKKIKEIFAPLKTKFVLMSSVSAEMAKHALNAYLATSISFMNYIADICERIGADVLDVVKSLRSDPRIGEKAFLNPGLGFAGGTLGRDLKALAAASKKAGVKPVVIESVYEKNRTRAEIVKVRLGEELKNLQGKTIAILGLTYKAGTKTLRRSRAIEIAKNLSDEGAIVHLHDPHVEEKEIPPIKNASFFRDPYEAVRNSSAVVLITPWQEFKNLDFVKLKSATDQNVLIFDAANFLSDKKIEIEKAGFNYFGVGRNNET